MFKKAECSKIGVSLLQFFVGAIILILEITGTRIISPFYGGSLYVWASLIAVTLLSLAGGYFLGGFLADKYLQLTLLFILLLGCGAYIVIIPLLSSPLLVITNSLGIQLGVLVSSFLLFSGPLFVLGMVTPFVLKITTSSMTQLGITSGFLYGIATLGSCVGALCAGFILIPKLGVFMVFIIIGGFLVLLGLIGLIIKKQYIPLIISLLLSMCIAVLLFFFQPVKEVAVQELVKKQSEYGTLRVVDQPNVGITQTQGDKVVIRMNMYRYLLVNSTIQNYMLVKSGETDTDYVHIMTAAQSYNPAGKNALLIGLGAGFLVKLLSFYDIKTDVVEIDPDIVEIAKTYFNFQSTGTMYIEDGRYILNTIHKKYDYIFIDAYLGGSPAYQLFSKEAISKLKSLLHPAGILSINILDFTDRSKAKASKSVQKTLESLFPHIHVYGNGDQSVLENIIFFASKKRLNTILFQPDDDYPSKKNKHFRKLLPSYTRDYSSHGGEIISDNQNPLEELTIDQTNEFRSIAMKYFGPVYFTRIF